MKLLATLDFNRLAEGIAIGCGSLPAILPADEQLSAFCIYLRFRFFNRTSGGIIIEYQPCQSYK
jgi:hypothetical protein